MLVGDLVFVVFVGHFGIFLWFLCVFLVEFENLSQVFES